VKCEYHTDQNRLDESDGVIFHLPTFYGLPPHKNPNHIWVMLCMEGYAQRFLFYFAYPALLMTILLPLFFYMMHTVWIIILDSAVCPNSITYRGKALFSDAPFLCRLDKSFMDQFDMHMNYYLDSDIVTGYWSGKRDEWFTPPVKKVRPGSSRYQTRQNTRLTHS
jgi:hypothetical protein